MSFGGRNLVYDAGPQSDARPAGSLSCLVRPWTGGNSTLRHEPYPCADAALRLVDGVIGNQESMWTKEAQGTQIASADGRVRFKKPQQVRAIAIYEDNSGPIATAGGVSEKTAMHYGVYVRIAKTQRWQQIGHVVGNTQLVNIFAGPPVEIDEIHYFWAGRNDSAHTDGYVRATEIEAYSSDELSDLLDNVDGLLND